MCSLLSHEIEKNRPVASMYLVLKDNSSAWSDFVSRFLKRFIAHMVKKLNIETEKSEQTLFVQISLSQYSACATKQFKDHKKLDHADPLSAVDIFYT